MQGGVSVQETRLVVVRHGETEWNVQGRIQGHLDSRLTEAGRTQAEAVARRLAGEAIGAVYASDLGRVIETVAPAARVLGREVVTDVRLRERHLGIFQGKTFPEAERDHPALFARFKARDRTLDLETGETIVHLRDRVAAALADIGARHPGDTVLVVTHGGVLDMIYRIATDMPLEVPRKFDVENASLNHLRWTGGRLVLDHWGDLSHHHDPASRQEF